MEPHPLAIPLSILFAFGEDFVVEHLVVGKRVVRVHARVAGSHARCPSCEMRSDRIHGTYVRTLADLAWQGTPVRLRLKVRRFRCDAARCARRTFTERLPVLVRPYARRTRRMTDLVARVGAALGGEAGARLLPFLGATASADTVLREVRRAPTPTIAAPRVIGVDEWARRKGHTYGTILVDLERREPVALLPERSSESFAAWLREHPGVEVIARARSEIYAEGARQGAPDAVQVADRWHLLKNAGDVLERVLQRHRSAFEKVTEQLMAPAEAPVDVPIDVSASMPADVPMGTVSTALPETQKPATRRSDSSPSQLRRHACYEKIQALKAEGVSSRAIARKLHLSRTTVRKYLRAEGCPTYERRTKVGTLTTFDAHLRARWQEGCRNAASLWRELQALGFGGGYRSVQLHIKRWRSIGEASAPSSARSSKPSAKSPSPRQTRWWLLLPEARLSPDQRRFVAALTSSSEAVRVARDLAVEFGRFGRARDCAALDPWLVRASACDLAEFRDFAAGLRHDGDAVRAAVELAWSNGQTEGQVNRLKMLKRQMYGRASVGLLERRVLSAA